jgi:hypothetical protein
MQKISPHFPPNLGHISMGSPRCARLRTGLGNNTRTVVRVTVLGKFSPIRKIVYFGQILKNKSNSPYPWDTFSTATVMHWLWRKIAWATVGAIFSQTHLVTLMVVNVSSEQWAHTRFIQYRQSRNLGEPFVATLVRLYSLILFFALLKRSMLFSCTLYVERKADVLEDSLPLRVCQMLRPS